MNHLVDHVVGGIRVVVEQRQLLGPGALREHDDVARMQGDIEQFLDRWLDALARDHRSYVTVAIGCTGGQHRSVFLVEQLARGFSTRWAALKRHRELDALS